VTTVLVVDDDRTFCNLVSTVLEMEGYETHTASPSGDVLDTAQELSPGLILMDVNTKDGSTLEVVRALKTGEETRSTPIIMVSGMDWSAECSAAGADSFLLKPFHTADLLKQVSDLLEGRGFVGMESHSGERYGQEN
jgi:CheY-like chemotaxis protein